MQVAFVDSSEQTLWGPDQTAALEVIAASEDPRLAWIIVDMMRFVSGGLSETLAEAGFALLDERNVRRNQWGVISDHLIAWDIPAPPGYLDVKRAIYTSFVPGWDGIFTKGDIDWRMVSWGGVFIDDRPYDTTDDPCQCIPAADNPAGSAAPRRRPG